MMYWGDDPVPEPTGRTRDPDPEEELQEQEEDPRVIISTKDFYDLLMEQQEQM